MLEKKSIIIPWQTIKYLRSWHLRIFGIVKLIKQIFGYKNFLWIGFLSQLTSSTALSSFCAHENNKTAMESRGQQGPQRQNVTLRSP